MVMPDAPRRRRGDQQNGQEHSEDDAPGFYVSKNAHATQSTGVDALIVGQTCGENNWLHFGRFLTLTLRQRLGYARSDFAVSDPR